MDEHRRATRARIEIRLLGPLEVAHDGAAVALGGPKPRALLGVLALEVGRVVSVDMLVEALWPGTPPGSALHAVQVYVSQLRKALGVALVARRGAGYVLELEPEQVDARRFARLAGEGRELLAAGDHAAASTLLREGLGLWRGPALADFTYEPFAQAEIARLEELRLDAVEARIEADLVLGRHADLVSELEALVRAEPLRERPHAQLMLALYRSGRQADALAAYRAAREKLVEDLGIEPGPDLRELEAAILRQDESLLLVEAAPAKLPMQFRRLVTVLFVDVVESMALAEALDPEALGQVLRRYFETVSAAIARHGGTVEKFAGDAVMATFGVPVSHEDDALRAARAALDIRTGIAALDERLAHEHGVGLAIRIGLEAGEVLATPTEARQRLVTGEAVGIAARLEQSAGAGEIVVGELVGRLIDHATALESLGPLEIKGKREPVQAYRLLGLTPAPAEFESRADAPLVGRKRDLASLRSSLKRARESESPRLAVVVGPPGVGKSRLAAELTRRTRGVTAFWGRCLSYGEGITYWALREVVRRAPSGEERDAVLAALYADTPPSAAEIALLFRRFCEAQARARPLLLVFDDVHWAEPTFLELVEQLVDRGEGPILVLCLAREELLEERPELLEGRENVDRLVLDALSEEETDVLLESLGGGFLESDQRTRILEAAEGNPLFLQQLLAHALEGGLAADALPPTVQALLAARLDRLGPGERAVLERGAVVGKEFTGDDVTSLLEPEAVPTAGALLETLADRGFVLRVSDGEFAFRHVLVRDAAYRAAPKRLRAELHERFADRLDAAYADLPDLDEFVGYHLEQAYRLRTELGEVDRRAAQLAEDGGRRLGAAGIRAWKRVDVPATTSLLGRATSLLPDDEPLGLDYLCELGIALRTSGRAAEAADLLDGAIERSRALGDRRLELRARIEREYLRLLQEPRTTADALLAAIGDGIPVFETAGDERALGRAWLLHGFVQGLRGQHKTWEESAERALVHYRGASWPTSTCVGEIAAALYYGPTRVEAGIARCEELLRDQVSDRVGTANVTVFLGGLLAQRGALDEARLLIASSRRTHEDLVQRTAAANKCLAVLGDIEVAAGEVEVGERVLQELCGELKRIGDWSHLASRAGDLADVLYAQGRFDEATVWAQIAEAQAAGDDLDAQSSWRSVRAKVHARCGAFDVAEQLAGEAARLIGASDGLNRRARVEVGHGEVLQLAGKVDEATAAFGRAAELYERKGNLVGAAHARTLLGDLAVV